MLVRVVRRSLLLSGATRSMAELAACEPFYAAPSGGTTAASYAHQAHAPSGFHEYTLVAKRDAGRDSKLLTFALPATMPTLGASVISGVKVKQAVAGEELDKSYSPTRGAAEDTTPRRTRLVPKPLRGALWAPRGAQAECKRTRHAPTESYRARWRVSPVK